ncbi:MAG: TolC family protein [bacterium]
MARLKRIRQELLAGLFVALAAALLWTTPAPASEPGEAPAAVESLDSLVRTAFENNPGIAAARARWQASVERYPQAKALPDPVFGVTYFPSPVETRLGPNRKQFKLNQMLPGFGKLKLKGKKAGKAAETARLKYEIAVRDVVTDVKISHAELQYLQEAIVLTQKNKILVERLLKLAERDYAGRKASFQDLMRTQSQLAQVTYDLLLIEEIRRTEETRINSLLGRPPEDAVAVSGQANVKVPTLGVEELYATAEKHRHEILLADVETEISHLSLGLAKRRSKPDFDLGVVYSSIGEAANPTMKDSGKDAWGIMLGVTLPVWFTKNRSAVREAEYGVQAAQSSRRDVINATNSMIKNLFFKIRTSARLVELYEKTLIPQARKSLELSETWYEGGRASLAEMLETQAVWLNFELALARARADLIQNLARLEQAVGYPLTGERGKEQ